MNNLLQSPAQAPVAATRPEVELLLCCARIHVDIKIARRIRALLTENIDWSYLIETATQHGVMPLLYRNLNATCPEAVPQTALLKLQNLFQTNAAHNRFLTRQLLDLLNLFEKHNIPAIPFKGPLLAASAYGNLALRQFCDLDILFHKNDVLKARNLLVLQGYENAEKLTDEQEIAQLQSPYVKAYTYKNNKLKVWVELHWKLRATYSSFPLDRERLWECLNPVSLANSTVFGFSPEDRLLYLCSHGFGDRWRKLLLICDIAELLRTHQEIDWERVMEQSCRLSCRRRLFLGLFLAEKLVGADLPRKVWKKTHTDPLVQWLAEWVCKRLFYQADESPKLLDQTFFDLGGLERLQDRLRYCFDRSILLIAKKFRFGFAKKYGLPGGK